MKFQYRVQGRVRSAFIQRGFYFKAGRKFDFCFAEEELDFVKKNCDIEQIIDLDAPKEEKPLEPVLEIEPEVSVKEEPIVPTEPIVAPKTEQKVEEKEIEKESKKDELHNKPRSPKNGNKKQSSSKVSRTVRKGL